MTELEFKALANQGYNRIPLIIEAIADLDTPLSLYLKLTQQNNGGKNSFLLESVVGGERFGRYSFIGLPASTVLRAHGMKTPSDTSTGKTTFAKAPKSQEASKAKPNKKRLIIKCVFIYFSLYFSL